MFTPSETRRAHEMARSIKEDTGCTYRIAYAHACSRIAEVKRQRMYRDLRTRAFAAYAGGMTIEVIPAPAPAVAPAPVIPAPAPVFRWREAAAAVAITFAVFASPLAAFAAPLL